MVIYSGVGFHARQQTVCYCDSAGGEISLHELDHERDDVGSFYSALVTKSDARAWFKHCGYVVN